MGNFVLRCGDLPMPLRLTSFPIVAAGEIPSKPEIDEVLSLAHPDEKPRVIVLGTDAALAAVLTALLRKQALAIEVGYVATTKTEATRIYDLETGGAAAKAAAERPAAPHPLIRDEFAQVIVGRASAAGAHGEPLTGEAYADDARIFSGVVPRLIIEPLPAAPGVRARAERGLRLWRKWAIGRAVQLGTPGAIVTRDGVTNPAVVPRATFYCHADPWLLAR